MAAGLRERRLSRWWASRARSGTRRCRRWTRAGRAALVAAALAVSAAHAESGPPPAPDPTQAAPRALRLVLPSAGIAFGIPRDRSVVATETVLVTFSLAAGPGVEARIDCPAAQRERTPVSEDGWFRLALETDADAAASYRAWLDAPSLAEGPEMSHRELLQRLWRALATGIDALRGARGRPAEIEFVVHVVPADCVSEPHVVHTPQQALQRVTFPLAFHAPAMLEPAFATTLLWHLVEVASHETVHLLQDYPFTRRRLDEIRRIGGREAQLDGPHTSVPHELHARMVDRCLRQAILPNDWNGDRVAQMWRDRRASFREHAAGDPFEDMYDELYRRQQRMLGRAFVNTHRDEDMHTLFGYCAMYLRLGPPVPASARPTRADRARGAEALRRMREVSGPIRLKGGLYGEHPLP